MRIKKPALLQVSAAILLASSGQALGQTFDQGTITRQRDPLTAYAPATDGWLSKSVTPRFWTWELSTSITVGSETSPYMQEWIHEMVPLDIVDSTGTIDGAEVLDLANRIANQIVSRGLQDGEYAIFLQNWTRHTRLAQAVPDELLPPLDSNGDPYTWPTQTYGRHSGNTGTPWRSTGLSYTYGEWLAEAVISYIETDVMNHPSSTYTTFPKPARVFFDEEFAFPTLCGINAIAAMTALAGDTRFTTETLEGNFSLWDATPTATTASELFDSAGLCDITAWLPATYDLYTINGGTNTCNDREYHPMIARFNGMLTSARDGLIEASFGQGIKNSWGTDVLWSNYSTSRWYSDSYPMISSNDRGARHPTQRTAHGYGFSQGTGAGSSDMHSMVLYPPALSHMYDSCPDTTAGCPGGVAPETHAQAWLRTARMELDHAIFSFDEIDDLEHLESPKHFAPWLLAVGTIVSVPNEEFDNTTITTKANARDIIALCKSRGANELIFWANPGASGYQNGKQTDWAATNDALSQVYDYNLVDVVVSTAKITSSDLDAMRFGEEHAYDLEPFAVGPIKFGALNAEFSVAPLTTPGASFSFISEVLDGGGPWAGAVYSLSIYNFDTGLFEAISAPTQLLSTSTRRAEFYDSGSDGFSDGFTRVFDDESDLSSGATVTDRKTINRWDLTIPMGSASVADYYSPTTGNMKFELVAYHSVAVPMGDTADPFRVDLLQLYETDAANDNLPYPEQRWADLNTDGRVDYADLSTFTSGDAARDLNNDGTIDLQDLRFLLEEISRR